MLFGFGWPTPIPTNCPDGSPLPAAKATLLAVVSLIGLHARELRTPGSNRHAQGEQAVRGIAAAHEAEGEVAWHREVLRGAVGDRHVDPRSRWTGCPGLARVSLWTLAVEVARQAGIALVTLVALQPRVALGAGHTLRTGHLGRGQRGGRVLVGPLRDGERLLDLGGQAGGAGGRGAEAGRKERGDHERGHRHDGHEGKAASYGHWGLLCWLTSDPRCTTR